MITTYPTAMAELVFTSMVEMKYIPKVINPVLISACRRKRPSLLASIRPDTIAPTTIPSIKGVRKPPLLVGEAPRTPWKKSGRKTIVPYSPKPARNATTVAMATALNLYISKGMMGATAFDSTIANITVITKPNASKPITCGVSHA